MKLWRGREKPSQCYTVITFTHSPLFAWLAWVNGFHFLKSILAWKSCWETKPSVVLFGQSSPGDFCSSRRQNRSCGSPKYSNSNLQSHRDLESNSSLGPPLSGNVSWGICCQISVTAISQPEWRKISDRNHKRGLGDDTQQL